MRKVLIALTVVVLLAGCDRGDHPQQMGTPAPAFTIQDGARTVRLSDYRGRVVLVNFWATWCAPCIEELPSLQALQRRMPSVTVLAISIDDDLDAYHRFLDDHKLTLLTVNDPSQRIAHLYGTYRYPETYVVDEHGIIRRKFISSQDWTNPEIVNYLSHL